MCECPHHNLCADKVNLQNIHYLESGVAAM